MYHPLPFLSLEVRANVGGQWGSCFYLSHGKIPCRGILCLDFNKHKTGTTTKKMGK